MNTNTPNSYVSLFTIHSDNTDIIIDSIQVTIDRIVLTCTYSSLENIDTLLKTKGKLAKDQWTKDKNGTINYFKRIRTYSIHNKQVSILYYKDKYCNENKPQGLTIITDEPDGIIMEELDNIFYKLNTTPKVSKVEIAWDFYTEQALLLKLWIKDHLWVRYNRKGSGKYKNTDYYSNPRESTKGLRCYPRPKNESPPTHLRLELELHRSILYKSGITFPITPEQLSIDFTKYFQFHDIDYAKLKNTYLRMYGAYKCGVNLRATHPARRHASQIYQQQIGSNIDSIHRQESFLIEKMEKVKKLGVKNHTRFLKPIDEINWIINNLAHEQGFCL